MIVFFITTACVPHSTRPEMTETPTGRAGTRGRVPRTTPVTRAVPVSVGCAAYYLCSLSYNVRMSGG